MSNGAGRMPEKPPAEELREGARRVFIVRHFGSSMDNWNEHKGSFDEVIQRASEKVADRTSSASVLDVVELVEVRRVRVEAVVATVEVAPVEVSQS